MKFMLTFSLKPDAEKRKEAITRFQKTRSTPQKGVKILGRWTKVDFSGGYDLLESDDIKSLTEFSLMWSDIMEISIVPVTEDQDLSEVLNRLKAA